MAKPPLLFVYGTLRRAGRHPMARWLAARARWLGRARVRGVLIRLDGYPALILSAQGDWISGDLYRLRRPARALARLDRYENGRGRGRYAAYARVRAPVERGRGGRVEAWVYVCNRPVAQMAPRMRSSQRLGNSRFR